MRIDQLALTTSIINRLREEGVTDTDQLVVLTPREVKGIPHIGDVAVARITEALAAHDLSLAEDQFAPYTCARDGIAGYDVALGDVYLCDECATEWIQDVFHEEQPAYQAGPLADPGFCVSCNQLKTVAYHQWYLHPICARVARSIGRGVAAERFMKAEWERVVGPFAPHLVLRNTDTPKLRSRHPGGPPRVASVDCVVRDTNRDEDVFGIEVKNGPRYVSGRGRPGSPMNAFQLDTSDCDDMMTVMRERGYPVYLAHVQTLDRPHPPTSQYVPLEAWWTDPFRMAASGATVGRRSRETRDAAFFPTSIFDTFASFADHVTSGAYEQIAERLDKEGVPALYTVAA